ncbi:unnamed protein product [Phaeothamnion confervicola]
MSDAKPKSPRSHSRTRSGSKSPLSRIRSKSSLKVDTESEKKSFFGFGKSISPRSSSDAKSESKEKPAAAPSATGAGTTSPSSPTSPSSGSPRSPMRLFRRSKPVAVQSNFFRDRLPLTLSALLATALAAVAVSFFYGPGEGPRLLKRDAPLYDGDVLRQNEYINTCAGFISFGCEPRYFELSADGELGLYEGAGPVLPSGGGLFGRVGGGGGGGEDTAGGDGEETVVAKRLWGSGTRVRGRRGVEATFSAEYKDGALVLLRDGKVAWKSPVSRLPRDMQPWPLHAAV